jgi:hypothetical protein
MLKISQNSADCLEFTYKYQVDGGQVRESAISLDYEDSINLLDVLSKQGEDAFNKAIHDYFLNIIENYNPDDKNHTPVLSFVTDSKIFNRLLPANNYKGMYRNIQINNKPLVIKNLAARIETYSLSDLKEQLDNDALVQTDIARTSKFLIERANQIAKIKGFDLNFVFTNGYLEGRVKDDLKLIGYNYISEDVDAYKKVGLYLKEKSNSGVIFVHSKKHDSDLLDMDEKALNILNHELMHFLFDQGIIDSKTSEKLTNLRTRVYKEVEGIPSSEIANNSEFVSYYITSNQIRRKANDELNAEITDIIIDLLSTPIDITSKTERNSIESNKRLIIQSLGTSYNDDSDYRPLFNNFKNEIEDENDELKSEDPDIFDEDKLPFMESTSSFFNNDLEPLPYDKDSREKSGAELYKRFQASVRVWKNPKDGKKIKDYSVAYGEYTTVKAAEEYKSNYRSLFRLKQGDIVYFEYERENKKGKKETISVTRPILYSFINKKGSLAFKLAANAEAGKSHLMTIGADEVIAFRKSYGTPAEGFDKTSRKDLQRIHDNFEAEKIIDEEGKEDVEKKETMFYTFKSSYEDEDGSVIEYDKIKPRRSQTIYMSINSNKNIDRIMLPSLKEGDVIKSSFKVKKDTYRDYYTPVVRVIGETVETVIKIPVETEKGTSYAYVSKFIPKSDIKGLLMRQDQHQDIMETAVNRLREVAKTGNFYMNKRHAFKKMSFIKYNPDNTIDTEKHSWNDVHHLYEQIEDVGGDWESYKKWRTKLGEEALKKLRKDDIKSTDKKTLAYFYMSRALDRRKNYANSLKFGDFIQVDRPKMKKEGNSWVPVEGESSYSPAMVVSQNGNWLNVLVYNKTFGIDDENNDPESGTKWKVTGDSVYFKKVRINQGRAEAKLITDKDGEPILKDGKKQYTQVLAIRSIFYDNSLYKAIIDNFAEVKQEFKENFENSAKYFSLLKAGKEIPDSLRKFNLYEATTRTQGDSETDLYYDRLGTKISDKYETEFFTDDLTEDERYKKIASLKPGDIVFKEHDNSEYKVKYTSSVVVDVKEDGTVLIGYREDKYGQYTIIPVYEEDIIGIGKTLFDDELIIPADEDLELEEKRVVIKGNPDKRKILESNVDAFKRFKQSLYFDSEEKALKWIKKNKPELFKAREDQIEITPVYVLPNGKRQLTEPNGDYEVEYTPELVRYSKKKDKYWNERIKNSDHWVSLYTDGLKDVDKDVLWQFIKQGDILTRKYDEDKMTDFLVIEKTDSNILLRTMRPDYENGGWVHKDHYMFYYSKSTFDDLHAIHLSKWKHNYKKATDYYDELSKGKVIEKSERPKSKEKRDKDKRKDKGSNKRKNFEKKTPSKFRPRERERFRDKEVEPTKTKSREVETKPKTTSKPKMFYKGFHSKTMDFKASGMELAKLKAFGDRLASMYNVNVNYMTSQEIAEMPNGSLLAKHRAFVDLDGNIIINSDYATLAEPIHELGHLAMIGLKSTDNSLYKAMISKMKTHDLYEVISREYPELDEEQLGVETFLTVSSEYFNNKRIDSRDSDFIDANEGFFKRIFRAIKNWLAKFMGVEERDFFELDPEDVMRLSFGDLFDAYNTKVMNGGFTKQVDLAKLNSDYLLNDKDVRKEPLYKDLINAEVSVENARDIVLATKMPNYIKWANDIDKTLENNAEDKLYFRIDIDTVTENKTENADPVFVKGTLQKLKNGNYKVENTNQIKSVYSVFHANEKPVTVSNIDSYAINKGIEMIGSYDLLTKNAKLLNETFRDFTFYVQSVGSGNIIAYHRKPSKKVSDLKNLMFNKNILQQLC